MTRAVHADKVLREFYFRVSFQESSLPPLLCLFGHRTTLFDLERSHSPRCSSFSLVLRFFDTVLKKSTFVRSSVTVRDGRSLTIEFIVPLRILLSRTKREKDYLLLYLGVFPRSETFRLVTLIRKVGYLRCGGKILVIKLWVYCADWN